MTMTKSTDVERIEAALSALLEALAEHRAQSGAETGSFTLDDPIGWALSEGVHSLGVQLGEIGGRALLDEVFDRVLHLCQAMAVQRHTAELVAEA
jgi:hypothetical protein